MKYGIISFIFISLAFISCANKAKLIEQESPQFDETHRVYYSVFIWYEDSSQLRKFEQQASPFFEKYGIVLHRIIHKLSAIEADGEDHMDTPDEVQLVSAVNGEALSKLFADENFQKLLPIREKGVRRMNIISSRADVTREVDDEAEVVGLGLFYFEQGGKQGLREFESQAAPYFEKYGLQLSHILAADASMAAIGKEELDIPGEIQFITVRNQEALQALFADQGFLDLVPLRAQATQKLTFFLGEKLL